MSKEKLWTKNFTIVSLINFLVVMVYFLLMVTIAGYAVEQFHASTSVAGLVSSIFIIGSLIGRLVTGRMIEGAGSKKTLLIGLILFILSTVLYFVTTNLPLLLMNRLFHGVAVGVASTATGTIIAQIVPKARRGEGIGFFSLSAVLATAIGPFVGMLFIRYADFQIIFLFNLLLAAICLVISFAVKPPKLSSPKTVSTQAEKGFKLSNYLEYKAVPISFVALVVGFGYSGVLSFLSFYAEEINLVDAAGFFFLVYSIMLLLSRPFSGRLMDAKGANIVIYPSLIVFAIGMVLFSQAYFGVILLVAAAFIGLGYGNFVSVAQTIAIQVSPTHRFGLATSTFYILYDLGLGAGPYLLGFIVPITGYRGLFLYMAGVVVIALVLYYFLHGRTEKGLRGNKTGILQGN
ncbi:MFS family permease [Neobacillus niacini]|uniref:MFS transporter n=1 Tax=Neobacillus niacini TaxID=86668 RepID=UPI00285E87B4|nr:MFS transporter [Neobacillus niacini]MDR7079414.1 MFS family permease [Neobacillus niacini]